MAVVATLSKGYDLLGPGAAFGCSCGCMPGMWRAWKTSGSRGWTPASAGRLLRLNVRKLPRQRHISELAHEKGHAGHRTIRLRKFRGSIGAGFWRKAASGDGEWRSKHSGQTGISPDQGGFSLVIGGAPGRIRTCAHGSGGRCSLP